MKQPTGAAITSLPSSPTDERRSRMIKYSVAMAVRLVCIGACFVTPGWWLLIPALGAIVLPYFAVVVANQVAPNDGRAVERPGQLLPYTPPGSAA
ncbi:hypothetical protein GCM10009792_14660 [Microcella alkalica]|uniref:DUF3099 domain-containing protein n=1 Tax=Microcella alkalica TaxID=355930 RepID=A0A839EAA3_9MICO|nr:DUF3099 domain-containing protein [Microcella alkalica]MBA8847144.1 hypothetical protein [Microcella alkalica]